MAEGIIRGLSVAERAPAIVTVRRHSAEVVRKLGVRDRREAIALVQEQS